ncbi:MAG: YbjN domain-containing protein [Candidatus Scalindua sp.]|nr:YbjN domain-containing protein [Candidatus Scalindua sp.]
MSENLEKVKTYLDELGFALSSEDTEQELVIIDDEDQGIKNLVIDCEYPILVLEQVIMNVPQETGDLYRRLLQMNRTLVHGAFTLDEEGKRVIFRDTLQLENLDKNELEGSINALSIALAEFAGELIAFSKV